MIIRSACFLWLVFIISYNILLDKFFLMTIIGSIPTIVFVAVPVVLSCFVLIFDRVIKSILVALFGLTLGLAQFEFLWIPPQKDIPKVEKKQVLRVVNWNTDMWDSDDDRIEFYSYLKSLSADVYILQEKLQFSDSNNNSKKSFPITRAVEGFPDVYSNVTATNYIDEYFPEYHLAEHQQYAVISKYPITKSYIDSSDQFQTVDILVEDKPVRIFNVHIVMHIETFNPFSEEFYSGAYRRYQARKIGLANLYNETREYTGEYLIAGDFNSPKTMGVMDVFLERNIDLFIYGKERVPFTMRLFDLRLWRIDWIFVKKDTNISVLNFRNIENKRLSDHSLQIFQLAI